MPAKVSPNEVKLAQKLPEKVKLRIAEFESSRWAASTTEDSIKELWLRFLADLTSCMSKQIFTEKEMLILSSYLTTKDALTLMSRLDELTGDMLMRFLILVEWYASSGQNNGISLSAQQFVERVNTTYRLYMLPVVFSEDRIEKAISAIKN
tara:strand:+ start:77 stop:529 length:453 start_codon:yes stop_codon:yes gene_type:complete